MNTIKAAAASVTGSWHLRAARNGQDAALAWVGEGGGAVVVCDGCSAGHSSEVGAKLGARLFLRAIAERIGEPLADAFASARAAVGHTLGALFDAQAIPAYALFTVVAAAVNRDEAAVWALGDGAYSFGDRTRVLGPFADNQPPYLGYDLLGAPAAAVFERAPASCETLVIATDGACELALERFAADRFVDHPDALRRELAQLARSTEHVDWDARRVVRTPAACQDDLAVGVLRWRRA